MAAVDLARLTDPDVLGEALRNYAFVGEGYGCYSTFDVAPDFRLLSDAERHGPRGLRLARLIAPEFGDLRNPETDRAGDKEIAHAAGLIHAFTNGDIDAGWLWDGDGCLAFVVDGRIGLVNGDCKCQEGWRFVPVEDGVIDHRNIAGDEAWLARLAGDPKLSPANAATVGLGLLFGLRSFAAMKTYVGEDLETVAAAIARGEQLEPLLSVRRAEIRRCVEKYPHAGDTPRLRQALALLDRAAAAA